FLCGICGTIANALPQPPQTASSQQATATPTAQASQAAATSGATQVSQPTNTPVPTAKPTQKPTQKPAVTPDNGPALLGSNISAFTAHYGPPDAHTDTSIGNYHYQKYGDSNIDFLIVWTDQVDGGVYSQRVQNVNVQADTSGWSASLANTKCAVF